MRNKVTRVSCSPGKISLTLSSGEKVESYKNYHFDPTILQLLQEQFPEGENVQEGKSKRVSQET